MTKNYRRMVMIFVGLLLVQGAVMFVEEIASTMTTTQTVIFLLGSLATIAATVAIAAVQGVADERDKATHQTLEKLRETVAGERAERERENARILQAVRELTDAVHQGEERDRVKDQTILALTEALRSAEGKSTAAPHGKLP